MYLCETKLLYVMKLDLKNMGLVLEGGGMRGVFTCGVLDYFMDHHIEFPYGYRCFGLEHVTDFLTCRISVDVPNIAISI